jgi:hypothetical protein
MIVRPPFQFAARVQMHLPGGFTRVILFEVAQGGSWIEIPTHRIPAHLRALGSKFLVTVPRFTPEASDTPEAIRELCQQAQVDELVNT